MAKTQASPETQALTVYAALLQAREEFAPVIKDETAKVQSTKGQGYSYKYVELSSVLAAVTPALTKHGLIVVQVVDTDDQGRPYLLTRLVHVDSGTDVVSRYPLQPGRPNDPQAMGGAITYARRYALLAVLGLAPEDDDGQRAARPPRRAEQQPADFDYERAIEQALRALGACRNVETMRRVWGRLDRQVKEDTRVIRAKDTLKAQLEGNKT